ncbi:MAG: hypothetical protein KDA61_02790 [Planctomycetales bacterium]|nr:hypothetical protein [Planctomycetales bacterium]
MSNSPLPNLTARILIGAALLVGSFSAGSGTIRAQARAGGPTFQPGEFAGSCGVPSDEGFACGAGLETCANACLREPILYAGFEATFIRPHFEQNLAYRLTQADGSSFERLSDVEFDYGLSFSPRVYGGVAFEDGIGARVSWWNFDDESGPISIQPPANGFGLVDHPEFGAIDISTNIPSDVYTARSRLTADAIDIEVTKSARFYAWELGVSTGVRYAQIKQRYVGELRDSGGDFRGRVDAQHKNDGVGPTLSLSGETPLGGRLNLFCKGRGSLLFGDASTLVVGGEDLDLTTPFTTTQLASRDDVLPIAELQFGVHWQGTVHGATRWRPHLSVAMEGQMWPGAGNAASEAGDLGFFGLAVNAGCSW